MDLDVITRPLFKNKQRSGFGGLVDDISQTVLHSFPLRKIAKGVIEESERGIDNSKDVRYEIAEVVAKRILTNFLGSYQTEHYISIREIPLLWAAHSKDTLSEDKVTEYFIAQAIKENYVVVDNFLLFLPSIDLNLGPEERFAREGSWYETIRLGYTMEELDTILEGFNH
ncbi:MAG: hypothetical protein ACOCXG_05065 [Nanoarchaeota archaeon]